MASVQEFKFADGASKFSLLKIYVRIGMLIGRSIACAQPGPAWFEIQQQKKKGGRL